MNTPKEYVRNKKKVDANYRIQTDIRCCHHCYSSSVDWDEGMLFCEVKWQYVDDLGICDDFNN